MFLQVLYSLITEISPITIFATVSSILSITLSLFEWISARLLLNTETVLIIKIEVKSNQIAQWTRRQFHKIENYRLAICDEIAKIIDIDDRLIELLKPLHVRYLFYIFYIVLFLLFVNIIILFLKINLIKPNRL